MCGIAGIATSADAQIPDLRERLGAMADAMLHRGPDDGGVYVSREGLVGLANRRLAIRDLSPAGHMPMSTADGTLCITYNGEIYNAAELRAELEAKGFAFRSNSDTEVILHGYRAWSDDVVTHLRGMFAFCIYDAPCNGLFLARDALGIKPLYYTHRGGWFAFASECKALVRSCLASTDVSPAGLVTYLELGSVPAPLTIYRDIRALEGGQSMRVDLGKGAPCLTGPNTYWRLPEPHMQAMPYAEAVARVHDLLLDSVRRHLVSDVPLGAFLSGGLDSSAIVALMRDARPGATIRTCSVSFAEPEFDESRYARAVADYFGTEHVEVRVTADEAAYNLDGAIEALDQPSNDGMNTYFVSQAARQAGLTVSLSGVGGDELFGGYPSFERLPRLVQAARAATRVPGAVRTAHMGLTLGGALSGTARLSDWLERGHITATSMYLGLRGLFSPSAVQQLVRPDVLAEGRSEFDLLSLLRNTACPQQDLWDATSRLEITGYMRHQLLRDIDAMSMAHSLEVRVPFVDDALMSGVLALPSAVRARRRKQLLRDAVPQVPSVVRGRRCKQGFTFPLSMWMAGPLRAEVHERVRDVATGLRDLFDPGVVDGVLAAFDQGRTHWSRIWALAALGTVLRTRTGSAPGHTLKRPACTTRTPSLGKVLGLFPTTELIGGIQTSGRVAWEGLSGNGATGSATMFCYCATPRRSRRISSTSNVHVGSKLSAVTSALGRQWDADLILVWHIGLLPLVPLFRRPHAKVAVALFGVDAWREVDPLTRVLLRHSDLLISISDYTWTRFAAANPSLAGLPHTTVHLGIGGVAAPHELRPPDDRPIALMISRLSQTERYKGHHEVIQCWPDVRSQVADAELWIVGDGGLRPQLERVAGEGVRFWGAVSEQKKADLIRQSRALVMPSRKEGFGLVYLEAMRLGRPCLVSTLDAGQEVIRPPEAGLAVNPADHPALTDALGRLMRMGDDWAAWSEQGRLRYEASYTARAYQDQLVSALVNVGCS